MFVAVNDVIVELQKKKVINSIQFSNLAKEIIDMRVQQPCIVGNL